MERNGVKKEMEASLVSGCKGNKGDGTKVEKHTPDITKTTARTHQEVLFRHTYQKKPKSPPHERRKCCVVKDITRLF